LRQQRGKRYGTSWKLAPAKGIDMAQVENLRQQGKMN